MIVILKAVEGSTVAAQW